MTFSAATNAVSSDTSDDLSSASVSLATPCAARAWLAGAEERLLIGFVYLWYDRKRHKFCVGSHKGMENDGYISGTGWMKNAYIKRPEDFRRRILERIYEGGIPAIRAAEQRWLDMIKQEEFGVRYYNLNSFAIGFDVAIATRASKLAHSIKDIDGKSIYSRRGGLIGGPLGGAARARNLTAEELSAIGRLAGLASAQLKDENGKSINASRAGKLGGAKGGFARAATLSPEELSIIGRNAALIQHSVKDSKSDKSIHAIKLGSILTAEKDERGRSVNAVKGAAAWAAKRTPEQIKEHMAMMTRARYGK